MSVPAQSQPTNGGAHNGWEAYDEDPEYDPEEIEMLYSARCRENSLLPQLKDAILSRPFYEWDNETRQAWAACTSEEQQLLVVHCFGQPLASFGGPDESDEKSSEGRAEFAARERLAWWGGIRSQLRAHFGAGVGVRRAGSRLGGTQIQIPDGGDDWEVDVGRQITMEEWLGLYEGFRGPGWNARLSYQGLAIELPGGPGGVGVDLLPANSTFFDGGACEFPQLFRTSDHAWAAFRSQEFFNEVSMVAFVIDGLKAELRRANENTLPLKTYLLDQIILRAGEEHLAFDARPGHDVPYARCAFAAEFLGGVLRSMSRMSDASSEVYSDLIQDTDRFEAGRRGRILAGMTELVTFARDSFRANRLSLEALHYCQSADDEFLFGLRPRPFSAYALFVQAHAGHHASLERQAAVKAATKEWWALSFDGRLQWYQAEAGGCQDFEDQHVHGNGQQYTPDTFTQRDAGSADPGSRRFAEACRRLRVYVLAYLPRDVVELVADGMHAGTPEIISSAALFRSFLLLYDLKARHGPRAI